MGLGHVGGDLARRLAAAGARLVVTDVDESHRALADELGADVGRARTRSCSPTSTCSRRARSAASSTTRRCRALHGAGDRRRRQQPARRPGVADLLAEHGVLWVPDFVVNAGGIVNIAVELQPGGYDEARADARRARDRRHRAPDPRRGRGATASRRWPRRWRSRGGASRPATHADVRPRGRRAPAARPRRTAAGPRRRACAGASASSAPPRGAAAPARRPTRASSSASSPRTPSRERLEQPPLAVEAVGEVLASSLAVRVEHRRAVTGADQPQVARAQRAQPVEVAGHVAGDEHAALAEHRVAGAAHVAPTRTRRGRRCGRAAARARAGRSSSTTPSRSASAGTASAWSAWRVGERRSRPRRRARRRPRRSRRGGPPAPARGRRPRPGRGRAPRCWCRRASAGSALLGADAHDAERSAPRSLRREPVDRAVERDDVDAAARVLAERRQRVDLQAGLRARRAASRRAELGATGSAPLQKSPNR